ncbi:putative lipid II flippase FtsW [Sciscionella marina]|uniref:putative lipid II flippase FtsW n=1 Tax=Sciscionella marina TaxID=508770 RepID=UPI0003679CA6|nr:putative lipid II flippase FtsW [Sciscionella marina]
MATTSNAGPKALGKLLRGARKTLTAWLSRPLASFHLILAIMCLLMVLGLIMVLSSSSALSVQQGSGAYSYFTKQAVFMGIGLVLFYVGLRTPLSLIRRLSGILIGACALLLVFVLFTPAVNGSKGWIRIGGFGVQPVELAKLALALWGAHVLVLKRNLLHRYRHLLVPLIPVALVLLALVALQPDMGSAVSLGIVLLALLWFVGAPLRLFGGILVGAVAAAGLFAFAASYRSARVFSFLNPGADPRGAGLQYNQSLQALADGGFFGRGLGEGASKWGYLPNINTDFIFALIGEELGFLGCAVVLGLFALLAWTGLRIAARNTDPWIRLVSASLTVWLVTQAAINIGYVIGLLPVTGVTLPLISYGGTSAAVTLAVFGVLANCARNEPEAVSALRNQGPGTFGRLLRLPAPEPYKAPPSKRAPTRPSAPPRQAQRPPTGPGANSYRRAHMSKWEPNRRMPRDERRAGGRR